MTQSTTCVLFVLRQSVLRLVYWRCANDEWKSLMKTSRRPRRMSCIERMKELLRDFISSLPPCISTCDCCCLLKTATNTGFLSKWVAMVHDSSLRWLNTCFLYSCLLTLSLCLVQLVTHFVYLWERDPLTLTNCTGRMPWLLYVIHICTSR